mgnify:CR=1 FL=1|tara:strand:+ start:1225 stop:1623 length:399 start_codon:yes stop_codon:yes gene_type:complete
MTITTLVQSNPRISIIIFSFLVTLFITVVTYYMTDRTRMKELKNKQKSLRKEIKKHRDNPQKMMELNKQMMEDMPEQLKHSFKPMLVTMIPIIIMLGWLRGTYTGILPGWFWWYMISSIVFSISLRKILGLQ